MSKKLFCGFCTKPYLYGSPRSCNCIAERNERRKAKRRKRIPSTESQ